jgi:hypothetical protein
MCTPAHAHANLGARLDLWSFSLAPGLAAAFRMAAPPRPRRGRVPRAHGRKGGGERRRSLDRHVHALPPAEHRTHTREPTTDIVLAATHGVGLGSASFPAATPLSRPTPNLAVTRTLRACFPAHAIARVFTRHRARKGHQHRRRADVAAPTTATVSPRQPPPPVLRPSSLATQGGSLRLPRFGRSPRRRGARRRRGHPVPPSLSPGHFVKHLGSQLETWVRVVHRRTHAGMAAANPQGSAAARPSPSRPHAGPHRAEPHEFPVGSPAAANGGPATRGLRKARPHPIRDPVWLSPYKGLKRIFISRNPIFSLKNPSKFVLTLKIVKPF